MPTPRLHLNVALLPLLGLFEIHRNGTTGEITVVGGIEKAFLNMLSDYLGFTYTVKVPDDLQWGIRNSDGNWTGLIGMIQRGEADMAVSRISLYEERLSVVDFSYPYYFENMHFAKDFPPKLPYNTAFLGPFSKNVWLCLFIFVLFMPIVLRFLLKTPYPLEKLILRVFGSFLNQATGLRVCFFRDKLLISSFCATTFFITICYSSTLLSFLTLPQMESDIRNFKQLSTAFIDGSVICAGLEVGGLKRMLLKSKDETLLNIGENMKEDGIEENKESVAYFIKKEKGVLIGPLDEIKFLADDVFISEDSFLSSHYTVAIRKNFPWKDKLDMLIHKISASGLYKKTTSDYKHKQKTSDEDIGTKQLTMEDLKGVFFIYFCGISISALVFIWEICLNACSKFYIRIGCTPN